MKVVVLGGGVIGVSTAWAVSYTNLTLPTIFRVVTPGLVVPCRKQIANYPVYTSESFYDLYSEETGID